MMFSSTISLRVVKQKYGESLVPLSKRCQRMPEDVHDELSNVDLSLDT